MELERRREAEVFAWFAWFAWFASLRIKGHQRLLLYFAPSSALQGFISSLVVISTSLIARPSCPMVSDGSGSMLWLMLEAPPFT